MLDVSATSIEQHQRFVERVVKNGEVWGLSNAEGWCVAPSNYDDDGNADPDDEDVRAAVLPFWSDRAYAGRCAKEEWADYEPTPIPLEQFLENWLPLIAENGDLVGTNWNAHLIGAEVDALDLKAELEERISTVSATGEIE
jgi:hypothetical protein